MPSAKYDDVSAVKLLSLKMCRRQLKACTLAQGSSVTCGLNKLLAEPFCGFDRRLGRRSPGAPGIPPVKSDSANESSADMARGSMVLGALIGSAWEGEGYGLVSVLRTDICTDTFS